MKREEAHRILVAATWALADMKCIPAAWEVEDNALIISTEVCTVAEIHERAEYLRRRAYRTATIVEPEQTRARLFVVEVLRAVTS